MKETKKTMRKTRRTALRTLLIATVSLCLAVAAFAQSSNSSDLRGTVTDTTGAVIPGARVTILNTETGVVTELLTNDAGIYDSVSIRPGKFPQLQEEKVRVQAGMELIEIYYRQAS
jgi:hypothetical protein